MCLGIFHFGLERERNVSSRLREAKTKSCLNLFLIFIDRPEQKKERNDHNFPLPSSLPEKYDVFVGVPLRRLADEREAYFYTLLRSRLSRHKIVKYFDASTSNG